MIMCKKMLMVIFILGMSCSSKNITLNINYEYIKELIVTEVVTDKTWNINNVAQLRPLFDNYLSTAKKQLFKFKAVYIISFSYQNKNWQIMVNGNHVKINGITYKLNYDLENYIRNYLLRTPAN